MRAVFVHGVLIPAIAVTLASGPSAAQSHSHSADARPQTSTNKPGTQKPNRPKPENQPGAVMDAGKLAASHADHHEMEKLDGGGVLPDGWHHRFDLPTMKLEHLRVLQHGSSMHITSGPPGILWNPTLAATGDYVVRGTFTQLSKGEHREGYGPIIGGAALDAEGQRYLYFLVRQDGRFLVKERIGANTRGIVDWTPHKAIRSFGEDGRMTNELAIAVTGESVRFLVNGTEVQRTPRRGLSTDGIVGLRINHQLDIMVEHLSIEPAAGAR